MNRGGIGLVAFCILVCILRVYPLFGQKTRDCGLSELDKDAFYLVQSCTKLEDLDLNLHPPGIEMLGQLHFFNAKRYIKLSLLISKSVVLLSVHDVKAW